MTLPVLAYLTLVNLAAFGAMGWDKSCARRGVERIPERTLLALAAAGGAPGALLGQRAFRHKTRKQPFAGLLYAILSAQAALYVMQLPDGGGALKHLKTVPMEAEGQAVDWDESQPGMLYGVTRRTR